MRTVLLLCLVATGLSSVAQAAPPSDRVLPPWTPVTMTTAGNATELGVWGRTYRFDAGPWPSGITTAGQELLAGPVRLVASREGKPLAWQRSGHFVLNHNKAQATLTGWQANEQVIVDATIRLEFDGMMRCDLVLMPQRGAAKTPLDQLWLEIPLKRFQARLFHCWPGRWGSATNSGAVPDDGLASPFKSLVWLGGEDGGLSWFAESDQFWQPKTANQAIEVIQEPQTTVLRFRLLDSAPARLPVTWTFGFQATPVKPMPADFHEWRIWHAPQLGTTLGRPAFEVFPDGWKTNHRAFPDGRFEPALDQAAKAGVKTVVFHEDWAPIQNYPATSEEAVLKRTIDACHARGMKVLLYFGYELSPLAPEWAEMADDVLIKNTKGASTPGWHRLPEQRDFHVCYRSRWKDVLLDGITRFRERMGFDGVYLDGTAVPTGCSNERHGCGYRTADGTLRPTYPIFAVRELMRGLYEMVLPIGGMVNAHQSTCCMPPTLAFAHSYWDGEQFATASAPTGAVGRLPLDAFRAEFMGRNFGVPCEFLAYERPPHWTLEHALALSMLHDVRVRPHGTGPILHRMASIWDVMARFGTANAQWHPYWKNAELVRVQPESVKASLYLHPAQDKRPGRALLVVSNLSATAPVAADVQLLDLVRLRLGPAAPAQDALSKEVLSQTSGRLAVPLEPMHMRLVWIE
ncbi:MAG: glycoside hydrolase domain-containing protein [Thermoguttaceae bacterium]